MERLASNDAVVRDSRARKEADQEDAAREEVPLTFIVGKNTVVKGIENAVVGMEVGEVKDVVVAATEAYGDRRDDLTATIPKENCPEGMKVGMTVSLSNGLQAVVTEEDPSGFTIDANHPLAGVEMKYTIEVVENVPSDQVKEVRFVDSHALVFPCSTIIPTLDRSDGSLAGILRCGVLLGTGAAVQADSWSDRHGGGVLQRGCRERDV